MHSSEFLPMSDGSIFGRPTRQRLKGRRLTRRTGRRIARTIETPTCGILLESLCKWAAGMPWVIETPVTSHEQMRLFMVDCPVLSRHAPWFAVEADWEAPSAFDRAIYLVLPQDLVQRGVERGWARGNEVVGKQRSLTAVASPTSDVEFQALQRLLAGTYEAAFE